MRPIFSLALKDSPTASSSINLPLGDAPRGPPAQVSQLWTVNGGMERDSRFAIIDAKPTIAVRRLRRRSLAVLVGGSVRFENVRSPSSLVPPP
jgi:hypothetical protein